MKAAIIIGDSPQAREFGATALLHLRTWGIDASLVQITDQGAVQFTLTRSTEVRDADVAFLELSHNIPVLGYIVGYLAATRIPTSIFVPYGQADPLGGLCPKATYLYHPDMLQGSFSTDKPSSFETTLRGAVSACTGLFEDCQ
jgi:hypothetical protein